ncbi:hypothetical protein FA15DRAFT_567730, partial [Coprinopsis marcescibilis]
SDPLVFHGKQFARTTRAFINFHGLLRDGLTLLIQVKTGDIAPTRFQGKDKEDWFCLQVLFKLSPTLEDSLVASNDDELSQIAELLTKGARIARADDSKTLRQRIVQWIIDDSGGVLSPPIHKSSKKDRGFKHYWTGKLLCPTGIDWDNEENRSDLRSGKKVIPGDAWPTFCFKDYVYNDEDPYEGLLKSDLLVTAYRTIFFGASSHKDNSRTARKGYAEIYGMRSVSIPSLIYIAAQVRFALTDSGSFNKVETISETIAFYNDLLSTIEIPDPELDAIVQWWN